MKKYICEFCKREFEKSSQLNAHKGWCKLNPKSNYENKLITLNNNRNTNMHTHTNEKCACKYCNNEYYAYGLKNHEKYCLMNPNKIDYKKQSNYTSWNKGLTKDTDERVKKCGETYHKRVLTGEIVPGFAGKHWSEEDKKRISEDKKRYYLEHPDKIPYKLWHSSKISYPEQYFMDIFKNENIDLKYHLQIGLYELDFYNENKKIYVEIDGDTHKKDKVKKIDARKDKYLSDIGWIGFRIDWSDYQKMNFEEKQNIVQNIKNILTGSLP